MTIHYKTLSGEQMYKDYYGFGENPIDATLFYRLQYLHVNEMTKETHIIALNSNKVIGDVGLQINPYDTSVLWFKHVVLDQEYRNQGISKELINKAVEYAIDKNMKLEISSYSEDGRRYLSNIFLNLFHQYPGIIIPNSDMKEDLDNQGLRF